MGASITETPWLLNINPYIVPVSVQLPFAALFDSPLLAVLFF